MPATKTVSRWFRTGLAGALVLGAAACGDKIDIFNAVAIRAANIEIVSGDAQEGIVGQPLADPLTVRVTDVDGDVVAGAVVVWVPSDGTVSAASTRTDANGIATVEWSPGVLGAQTLRATIANGEFVTFAGTGLAN